MGHSHFCGLCLVPRPSTYQAQRIPEMFLCPPAASLCRPAGWIFLRWLVVQQSGAHCCTWKASAESCQRPQKNQRPPADPSLPFVSAPSHRPPGLKGETLTVSWLRVIKNSLFMCVLDLSWPVTWLVSIGVSTSWIALSSCCPAIISGPSLKRVSGGFAAWWGGRRPEGRTEVGAGQRTLNFNCLDETGVFVVTHSKLWHYTIQCKSINNNQHWMKWLQCNMWVTCLTPGRWLLFRGVVLPLRVLQVW